MAVVGFLAYAEGSDTSDSSIATIVIALAIIAGVCVLAAIPVAIARRRARPTEGVAALMVLWGLLAAGSAIYATNASMTWQKEYNRRLMSGYLDPADQTDRPRWPWILWAGLGVAYGGVLFWGARGNSIDDVSKPRE